MERFKLKNHLLVLFPTRKFLCLDQGRQIQNQNFRPNHGNLLRTVLYVSIESYSPYFSENIQISKVSTEWEIQACLECCGIGLKGKSRWSTAQSSMKAVEHYRKTLEVLVGTIVANTNVVCWNRDAMDVRSKASDDNEFNTLTYQNLQQLFDVRHVDRIRDTIAF